MSTHLKILHTEDLENQNLIKGALVNFTHSEAMTLAEWKFEANTSLPEHTHPHEQITKIISGEFELIIEKVKYNLKSGSVAIIPSNAVHSAYAVTRCHVIDVFHPVRQDYKT